jgi:hypothetical protein
MSLISDKWFLYSSFVRLSRRAVRVLIVVVPKE